MLQLVRELFSLLDKQQRTRFVFLQLLVILMAFAEIASITIIGPFMLMAADVQSLEENGSFSHFYHLSGLNSPEEFVFWAGIAVLAILLSSSLVSVFTAWRLSLFSFQIGAELGNRLFSHYINQPWLFHVNHSSASLTMNIAAETGRITNQVLSPLLQMNSRIVLATFIVITVFIYNPYVAIAGVTLFGSSYALLFTIVRHRLTIHGQHITKQNSNRFKLMSEAFGGIKDILLFGYQDNYTQRFIDASRKMASSLGVNQTLASAPKYLLEMVAFSSMITLVLYLILFEDGNAENILPSLAVYGLAGFKLMPAFQNIYQQLSQIRGALPAYQAVRQDLIASQNESLTPNKSNLIENHELKIAIDLKNVSFSYPGKNTPAIDNINLHIPAKKTVGIVGPSGSGKSTLIDLILGLITPSSGSIIIDEKLLPSNKISGWQKTIGFVSQTIYLSDASLKENIAFGIPEEEINITKVLKAAHLAHLDEVISRLPDGIETLVGERGVQLSGGQRQRIGIARALYHDASVLVFDEATSALDGITEKLIMQSLHEFFGKKTIIMIAHRLKTVQNSDIIFFMKNGKLIDQGSFEFLKQNNSEFSELAKNS